MCDSGTLHVVAEGVHTEINFDLDQDKNAYFLIVRMLTLDESR